MAGVMAGVMHAPLTGIFLIAEFTGGYQLFTAVIITSVISYLTIMIFEPHGIYTKRLAKRGELMTHHKDRNVLQMMKNGIIQKIHLAEDNRISLQPETGHISAQKNCAAGKGPCFGNRHGLRIESVVLRFVKS